MKNVVVPARRTSGLVLAAVAALVLGLLPWSLSPAAADTAPSDPNTPATVAADPLPTVQINGVVWAQKVIGNTVYAAGNFSSARPAGSAAGQNETPRANLLAYDIRTGNLISSWAPTTNGEVNTITASPDGKRIYIGGIFTTVNGQTRSRIAALDATTGATVQAFQARADGRVRAIAATQDTVYIGGLLTQINGVARSRVGAVRASDGAVLGWTANPQGGSVHVLTLTPQGDQLLIGGNFTTMNGSSNPGYGLASLSPTTGELLPWAGNGLIRNGGANAAITAITTDGDSAYVSGFVFGSGGNLEGVSRMDLNGGEIKWVQDCHGDTYGTFPKGDVIYVSSHAHYCGNLPDGFPQTEPWTQHYGTAFTKAVTGTLGREYLGYYNYEGTPAPSLLKWIPLLLNGTFTGQGQAGWNIVGNDNYVAIGGEFPRAGNQPQQGLVRYAVRSIAPNKVGPEFSQSKFNPRLSSFVRGQVRVTWQANWDRDNENLTYQVIRDGNTARPVYETTQASSEWKRPMMGYTDTGLVPGQTYRYRLFAKDPLGNEVRSDTVSITASADGELSSYATKVLADGATAFWRLGEDSGTAVNDWAGFKDATAGSGVTRGADGAIVGDANKASTFNGTQDGTVGTTAAETGPNTFTTESWIKTTSTSGGKILGFGSSPSGTSGSYDRHVYMTNDGRITFGVYPNTVRTVSSTASYNDGQWHQVVTSLGPDGMQLWIDGRRVGVRSDTTNGQAYDGYWRIGGDNVGGWPGDRSSNFLNGTIDDVSIYPTVLSGATIRSHYVSSGRDLPGATAPADAYGKAVYDADPDLYWRLSDAGSAASDASASQNPGTFDGGVVRGGGSGVGVNGDSSVELDGSDGAIASDKEFSNPTTYSQELWFKTTTQRGGKLIGFGGSKFGLSSNYDRHVWMLNDGRLNFGVWTGFTNIITSPASYNDGTWHHVVAMQSSDGMKLYVDGQLVGTNGQTNAQDYSGYWRVGGDTHWGGADSYYFAGSIDEVAVYSKALSAATVADHFSKGGGRLPNVRPSAAFTSSSSSRTVSFDGSTSTDSDGSIASYSWSFGDGASGTGATPEHTYTADGTYTVSLTVTDDRGGQDTTSQQVTVSRANDAPTASFTSTVTDLTASFDAGASSDPDGTIASYSWNFGDGGSSTGPTATHAYGSPGTYQVTLTVTDDKGATGQLTSDVTATAANAKPTAAFGSTVADLAASYNAGASSDSDGTIASYSWDFGDGGSSTGVTASHTYGSPGSYQVTLTVTDDDGATDRITKSVTVTAPPAVRTIAADTFSRSATNGWGTADTGGTWSARSGTPTSFAVDGSAGTTRLTAAGKGTRMTLGSVSGRNVDSVVDLKLDKDPAGGGGFFTVANRVQGTSEYRGKLKVNPNGTLAIYVTRVVNGTETTLQAVNLPTTTRLLAGETVRLRLETTGNGTTTVRARAWKPGTGEPTTWQVSATDSSSELQTPGAVALDSYISATSTNVPILTSWDNLKVVETN